MNLPITSSSDKNNYIDSKLSISGSEDIKVMNLPITSSSDKNNYIDSKLSITSASLLKLNLL